MPNNINYRNKKTYKENKSNQKCHNFFFNSNIMIKIIKVI